MYNTLLLVGFLIVLAALLMHYKPAAVEGFAPSTLPKPKLASDAQTEMEGFAVRSVDPLKMPECVSRSTDAQSLLARIADYESEDAAELRLLVSKLCCMEADIAAPSAGVYRTFNLQFRTSQDTEPPATIVGRCLRNAVNKRDIELIIEKFASRGHALLKKLSCDPAATTEFDKVVAHLKFAMTSFCLKEQPVMDRPLGARDMGFWEPENVADLSQYQGVSAVPK